MKRDVVAYRKIKEEFNIDEKEEENYEMIRNNYSYEQQAHYFYDELHDKKSKILRLKKKNKELKQQIEQIESSFTNNFDLKDEYEKIVKENKRLEEELLKYKNKLSNKEKSSERRQSYQESSNPFIVGKQNSFFNSNSIRKQKDNSFFTNVHKKSFKKAPKAKLNEFLGKGALIMKRVK